MIVDELLQAEAFGLLLSLISGIWWRAMLLLLLLLLLLRKLVRHGICVSRGRPALAMSVARRRQRTLRRRTRMVAIVVAKVGMQVLLREGVLVWKLMLVLLLLLLLLQGVRRELVRVRRMRLLRLMGLVHVGLRRRTHGQGTLACSSSGEI